MKARAETRLQHAAKQSASYAYEWGDETKEHYNLIRQASMRGMFSEEFYWDHTRGVMHISFTTPANNKIGKLFEICRKLDRIIDFGACTASDVLQEV